MEKMKEKAQCIKEKFGSKLIVRTDGKLNRPVIISDVISEGELIVFYASQIDDFFPQLYLCPKYFTDNKWKVYNCSETKMN